MTSSKAKGMVKLNTAQGAKSPVEVSAEILKVLKKRAEDALGGELVGAVVTVPAYLMTLSVRRLKTPQSLPV